MKIGIIGTRGIPNNYGGFEQFAEFLSKGLSEKGHEVYVYNPHHHFSGKIYQNVHIIHAYDAEPLVGTAGQFIYDLNAIRDSRKRNFDIILQLGYTSSAIWGKLLPKTLIITNMDGFEWKRSKYNTFTKRFLRFSEKLAVVTSDHLVADHPVVRDYFKNKYSRRVTYIPYGAEIFQNPDSAKLEQLNLNPYQYDLLIARMEPENNIEMILNGVQSSNSERTMILIGDISNEYGKGLLKKFGGDPRIKFAGKIFDKEILDNLRFHSNIYFHGHSVGGTNPSLIEAMACSALICAHRNEFNEYILQDNAYYFSNAEEILYYRDNLQKAEGEEKIRQNISSVGQDYSWGSIIDQYEDLFIKCLNK